MDENYSATSAENTAIVAAGNVRLKNGATLFGDLVSGGSVRIQNGAEITGNVSYGTTLDNGGTIGGWTEDDANVSIPASAKSLIGDKHEDFESSNNNTASDALTGCSDTCTLHEGDYILDGVELDDNDELVLDTSGGDIEVAVRNRMRLKGDAKVRVAGNGTAKFYLDDDFRIQNRGNVSAPEQRSPRLWFYMNPGSTATMPSQP